MAHGKSLELRKIKSVTKLARDIDGHVIANHPYMSTGRASGSIRRSIKAPFEIIKKHSQKPGRKARKWASDERRHNNRLDHRVFKPGCRLCLAELEK